MGLPSFQAASAQSTAKQVLLNRDFVIEDPEVLNSLVQAIPPGAASIRILWRYDLPKQRAKVRCAVCGAHRHWKGYVVELDDGYHALLGGDCGRQAFGLEWDEVEAAFVREQDQQRDLRRHAAAIPFARALAGEIEAALSDRRVDEFEAYVTALRSHFGRFSQALAKAARQDGRLDGFETVPDRDAAERLARRNRPELFEAIESAAHGFQRQAAIKRLREYIEGKGKVLVKKDKVIGHTAGRALFLQNGLPRMRAPMKRAMDALVEAAAAANNVELGAGLMHQLELMKQALVDLDQALLVAKAFNQFTAPDNVELVAKWTEMAGEIFPETFTAHGRSLRRGDTRRLEVSMSWDVPFFGNLELLRDALRRGEDGTS